MLIITGKVMRPPPPAMESTNPATRPVQNKSKRTNGSSTPDAKNTGDDAKVQLAVSYQDSAKGCCHINAMRGLTFLCIVGYAIVNASSGILFKFAAENSARKALWYFIWGNLIGFLGPVALTLALKQGNPSVVYGLCFGGAFAVLQILS